MRKRNASQLPWPERLALSINETAQTLSVGRNSVYALIRAGKLKSVKLGSRSAITTASIRSLLELEAA